jgi:AcrR family transcriptional regulator
MPSSLLFGRAGTVKTLNAAYCIFALECKNTFSYAERMTAEAGVREPGPPGPGLRERSKARRRDAIIRAAYQLFAERGYSATTVADIATAAEVAPRTVAMYFPSKQDIALSRFGEAADTLTSALLARSPGEPVTQVVRRWLRTDDRPTDPEIKKLSKQVFATNPELSALRAARMTAAIAAGAAAIAAQTGCAATSPGPRLAAVAAAAILIELTDTPPGDERDTAIDTAMRFMDAGISAL